MLVQTSRASAKAQTVIVSGTRCTMRQITQHQTNECNKAITIIADERNPENGNASHFYACSYTSDEGNTSTQLLSFQNGPIGVVGTNGITHEVLLAILIDRLECFQDSKYANEYNQRALEHLTNALNALIARTAEREARGVEGTHKL
jgi:hypothetical protein